MQNKCQYFTFGFFDGYSVVNSHSNNGGTTKATCLDNLVAKSEAMLFRFCAQSKSCHEIMTYIRMVANQHQVAFGNITAFKYIEIFGPRIIYFNFAEIFGPLELKYLKYLDRLEIFYPPTVLHQISAV